MKTIKAKFKPVDPGNVPRALQENAMKDKVFTFVFAYELSDGSKHYEPTDKNFPSSTPVNEIDLEIIG